MTEPMTDDELGPALYEEMCRLDPGDDPEWRDMTDHEREFYRLCVARVLLLADRRLDAITDERDALREALKRYGRHDTRCASYTMQTSMPPKWNAWNACDCGFAAALAAPPADGKG